MTFLLELKEKMRRFYIKFSHWLLPVFKCALAMSVFMLINENIGFLPVFKNIFVMLIMALVCALVSLKVMAVFAGLLIIGHCYALGIEVAAFASVVFILLFVFVSRFVEKESFALLVTPIACMLGIPCAVPVGLGLKGKPQSALAVCSGTFVYYMIKILKEKAQVLQGLEKPDVVENVRLLLDAVVKNKEIVLSMGVMTIVLILVYILRRLAIDHAWSIAAFVGAAVYAALTIAGGMFLDVEIRMMTVLLGAFGALIVDLILVYFILSVDYTRTERLEFEDDEYYYYVKAVPKMSISKYQKQVKTIVVEPGENILGENREPAEYDETDLEKKLEESLREL